ncbi:hypothetical protein LZ32DRAFT_107335 [Colletotrichum eremochloae]|nr:hypothetical protein LZ32DRAFT_107335 [Colletotrichum eremochloae]
MLSETAREVCLNVITNRARTIKGEIDRILNLASTEEFATIVAEIPISHDPDWDLLEPPQETSGSDWWTWDDAEDLTADPDVPLRQAELNVTREMAVESISPTNGMLEEHNSQDERSDTSSLASLIKMFRIHMERDTNDDAARQACAIQKPDRDSIQNEDQSRNSGFQAINRYGNLEDTAMATVPPEIQSHDCAVYLRTPRLAGENVDEPSLNIPPKYQTQNIVIHDQNSAEFPSDISKTSLREYFIQLWNEAVRVESLFRLLKSQEKGSMKARRPRNHRHRLMGPKNIIHPLRQSVTMEEYEARPDITFGRRNNGTRIKW